MMMNTMIQDLNTAYERVTKINPDIAGEVYLDTLERINKGVGQDFKADHYFFKVFKLKSRSTPKEKGRNNYKEVNMVAIDIDFEDEALPKGCVSDVVASKIDTGYEEVEERVSLLETVRKLKDEVELNELHLSELVEALESKFEEQVEASILSEITLSRFINIPEICELLKEALQFKGALSLLQQYC